MACHGIMMARTSKIGWRMHVNVKHKCIDDELVPIASHHKFTRYCMSIPRVNPTKPHVPFKEHITVVDYCAQPALGHLVLFH